MCGTGGETICCYSEGLNCQTVRDETCSEIIFGANAAPALAASVTLAALLAAAVCLLVL